MSVTVHNTGDRDGKEVVQVYMTDVVSSVVTPNQELVGFQKVDLAYAPSPLCPLTCVRVDANALPRGTARASRRRS